MAGKGGAPRAPSFREVNLDFWLEEGGVDVEEVTNPESLPYDSNSSFLEQLSVSGNGKKSQQLGE